MLNPALVLIIIAATVATSITVAVAVIVTASRLGVVLNVAIDILDLLERDRQRLLRIRKMRQILATGHRSNGSQPPVLYAPRHNYDEGGKR